MEGEGVRMVSRWLDLTNECMEIIEWVISE